VEWCKLFANLPDDPRVQAVEECGAAWLLVQSICYCTRAESDGFIPATQVARFGGDHLADRVAALAHEGLWVQVTNGYMIDPHLWNEEKNLNDQVEKKRKADRERIAAKRAKEKADSGEPLMSRDSRATSRATCRRDSRSAEKSREEIPPLTPPVPELPAPAVPGSGRGEGESPPGQTPERAALAAEIRAIRPDWATTSIERVLDEPSVVERPWPLVVRAFRAVARDPKSEQPGRLKYDGWWWHLPPDAEDDFRPDWCTRCDEETRHTLDENGYASPLRCPDCHPELQRAAS
jgi:hypothetical protein